MAICIECEEEYSDRRREIGYEVCLNCGSAIAHQEALIKARRTAPAYSKGAYQYITDGAAASELGRKL